MMTTLPPTAVALQQPLPLFSANIHSSAFSNSLTRCKLHCTLRHDPQTHVPVLSLPFALQVLLQLAAACTVSDDVL